MFGRQIQVATHSYSYDAMVRATSTLLGDDGLVATPNNRLQWIVRDKVPTSNCRGRPANRDVRRQQ